MMGAETYYLFYDGANLESKDLMNSSSDGNFTKNKASEARETLGRLIDAKKTYDNPRNLVRRSSANAVQEKEGEGVGARIDRLERALLSAIEKMNSFVSQEKEEVFRSRRKSTPTLLWSVNRWRIPSPGERYGKLESE